MATGAALTKLMEEAMKLAHDLANGPTIALSLIRKLYWESPDNSFEDQLNLEFESQRIAGAAEDALGKVFELALEVGAPGAYDDGGGVSSDSIMADQLAGVAPVVVGCFLAGLSSGVWDVAMNVHATHVERRTGRSMLPRFHAVFSASSRRPSKSSTCPRHTNTGPRSAGVEHSFTNEDAASIGMAGLKYDAKAEPFIVN